MTLVNRLPFRLGAVVFSLGQLAALLLHLLGALCWFFGYALVGSLAFYLGQLVLCLSTLYRLDRGICFQDIRLLFVLVYTLYGLTLPIVTLLVPNNIQGIPPDNPGLIAALTLYAAGLLGFNIALWMQFVRWKDVGIKAKSLGKSVWLGLCLLILVIGITYIYALAHGTVLQFEINRNNMGSVYSQAWVVLMFVVNGMLMYFFFYFWRLRRLSQWIFLLCAGAFVFLMISLGNRRDVLPLILFVLAVNATRLRTRFNWRYGLILAVLFLGFLYVGFARYSDRKASGTVDSAPIWNRIFENNEFVVPIQTLMYYTTTDQWNLHWGESYLRVPFYFIPREIWAGKPVSLSIEFLLNWVGTTSFQGFAYTPVTEAFVNFGWLGPLIMMVIFGLTMNWLVKNVQRYPVIYFVTFAYMVDFNRGEFAVIVYQLIIVYCSYLLAKTCVQIMPARKIPRITEDGLRR